MSYYQGLFNESNNTEDILPIDVVINYLTVQVIGS